LLRQLGCWLLYEILCGLVCRQSSGLLCGIGCWPYDLAKPGRGVKNEMLYVVGKAIRKPLVQTVSFELDRYKTMSKQAQAESRGHRHRY